MAIILGIDPGSRVTGYGIISAVGARLEYVSSGCIRMQSDPLPERLQQIARGINEIIEIYSPQEMAIEEVFMGRNAASALKLGHARGAAIVATMNQSIPVTEYSARKVKQAVVGKGAAKKQQVQHMICSLLKLAKAPPEDAADALAVAVCHAHTQQSLIRMAGVRSIRRGRML